MTAITCTGVGGGQSWDPFRPLQQSSVLQQSSSAVACAPAYTRKSSSKLVLQHRSLDTKAPAVDNTSKQNVLAQEKPAVSRAEAIAPNNDQAAKPERRHPTVTARLVQTTHRASPGRWRPYRRRSLQGRLPQLQEPSKKCRAWTPVRRLARTWKRQTEGLQSVRQQAAPKSLSLLQTPGVADQACAQNEAHHASAAWRLPTSLPGRPQSPKSARRRVNQLVRLSSLSAARSSAHLLCSG